MKPESPDQGEIGYRPVAILGVGAGGRAAPEWEDLHADYQAMYTADESREHLYTLGDYDIVMVTEFPGDDIAAAAVLQLSSLGNVRTKTMRAFTDQEAAAIITRLG